jgi:hypothetical protein
LIVRAFFEACLVIVILGAGGYFWLNTMQKPSGVAYATDGARIDRQWSCRSAVRQDGAEGAATPEVLSEECAVRTASQWIFVDFGIPLGESKACLD